MNETTQPLTLRVTVIIPRFVFTVRETEDGTLILACDLPGVRDSLKVTIQGRSLTVSTDQFSRDFAVGHEYDLDKIETQYEDGVLLIKIPPMPTRVITFKEQAPAKVVVETKAPDQIEAGIVNPVEMVFETPAPTLA